LFLLSVRRKKSGSFGFAKRWLWVSGQNQMCHLCGGNKIELKKVRWGNAFRIHEQL